MALKRLMKIVKFMIGLIPVDLKNKLNKNPTLLGIYRKALHRSGLFYGVPNAQEMAKLYSAHIKQQEQQFQKITLDSKQSGIVIVVGDGAAQTQRTLASLAQLTPLPAAVVLCHYSSDVEQVESDNSAKQAELAVYDYYGSDFSGIEQYFAADLASNTLLLNAGDTVHPKTFAVFRHYMPDAQFAYCDVDIVDDTGSRHTPYFKPDWNPDLQCSTEYINTGVWLSELSMLKRFFTPENSISHGVINAYLQDRHFNIAHLSSVLVHAEQHLFADANNDKLIIEHTSDASHTTGEIRSVCWQHDSPLVSLIIPTKNAKGLVEACINSILELTEYSNYEILLVDNNSDDPQALAYFDELAVNPKVRLLKYPHAFNYSAINNFAVTQAKGEIIGLINNDIEVISKDWLGYLVGHASRSDVGCVGAKLLYSDKRVQHAGVVLGYGGGAGHAHKYYPSTHHGYMNRLAATQNYSAVTAACLLVKKTVFDQVNGLNEQDLTVAFNDVDFCLKVKSLGLNNVYCAEAVLFHHESISRGHEDTPEKIKRFQGELAYLQHQWQEIIKADPAYNKHLTLSRENFALRE